MTPAGALLCAGALPACWDARAIRQPTDPFAGQRRVCVDFPDFPSPVPLRYRQRATGMLPGAEREVTWVLHFDGEAVTLEAASREVRRTSPAEQTVRSVYRGQFLQRRGLDPEISVKAQEHDSGFPPELRLSCMRAVVAVLPIGAGLVPGDACEGHGPPPRWEPAERRDVGVWFCEYGDPPTPLVFASGTGLEWVFVNNDCAGQEGAYRFVDPARLQHPVPLVPPQELKRLPDDPPAR